MINVGVEDGHEATYLPLVTFEDGRQENAIDLAKKGIQAWENIFRSAGLQY